MQSIPKTVCHGGCYAKQNCPRRIFHTTAEHKNAIGHCDGAASQKSTIHTGSCGSESPVVRIPVPRTCNCDSVSSAGSSRRCCGPSRRIVPNRSSISSTAGLSDRVHRRRLRVLLRPPLTCVPGPRFQERSILSPDRLLPPVVTLTLTMYPPKTVTVTEP